MTRWLGSCVDEELVSLKDTTIRTVLRESEDKDNYEFMGRDKSAFDVLNAFTQYEENGNRLEAIIVTESGFHNQKPLGIVTAWDLTKCYGVIRL